MTFIVFITVLFTISLFHRRENRLFEKELRALQKKLQTGHPDMADIRAQVKGDDWRVCGVEGTRVLLRRAFQVPGREAVLRYAVPVALLYVTIVYLNAYALAAVYAAALAVKWFACVTVLDLDPFTPRYAVRLFGLRLFGDSFTEEEAG